MASAVRQPINRQERTRVSVKPETLWYTRCPVPTASSIAIARGWLDEEFASDGIRVSSLRESNSPEIRESHFSHTQENSFRQGGNIPPIWARSIGHDVSLIGLSSVDRFQAVIALPDSGIEKPADLRGRRIGLPRRLNDQIDFWRATSLRGILTTLEIAGLSTRDVELVDLPVDETYLAAIAQDHRGSLWTARTLRRLQARELFALIKGEVDAIFTGGPRGLDLQTLLNARVVLDVGRHPDPRRRISNDTPTAITVSGKLARENPELVARYLARLIGASDWAREHGDETRRIVARDIGSAEEWVAEAFDPQLHVLLEPELSEQSIAALESQKDFLLANGFIQHNFNVREWVNPEPLARAFVLAGHVRAAVNS
jgi:ABC-type nitrate/sulfonate/bicarbonate transport system substrate-binding protein